MEYRRKQKGNAVSASGEGSLTGSAENIRYLCLIRDRFRKKEKKSCWIHLSPWNKALAILFHPLIFCPHWNQKHISRCASRNLMESLQVCLFVRMFCQYVYNAFMLHLLISLILILIQLDLVPLNVLMFQRWNLTWTKNLSLTLNNTKMILMTILFWSFPLLDFDGRAWTETVATLPYEIKCSTKCVSVNGGSGSYCAWRFHQFRAVILLGP